MKTNGNGEDHSEPAGNFDFDEFLRRFQQDGDTEWNKSPFADEPNPTGRGPANPWNKNPWDHPAEPIATLELATAPDQPPNTRQWLIPGWFPMLETIGLGGPGGEGKTLLAQMLGTAAALGTS